VSKTGARSVGELARTRRISASPSVAPATRSGRPEGPHMTALGAVSYVGVKGGTHSRPELACEGCPDGTGTLHTAALPTEAPDRFLRPRTSGPSLAVVPRGSRIRITSISVYRAGVVHPKSRLQLRAKGGAVNETSLREYDSGAARAVLPISVPSTVKCSVDSRLPLPGLRQAA